MTEVLSTDGYDDDGDGKDWTMTRYSYDERCYDDYNDQGRTRCPQPETTATFGNIGGHGKVTATQYDMVADPNNPGTPTALNRTITTYGTNTGSTAYQFGWPLVQTSGKPDAGLEILATQAQATEHKYTSLTYATTAGGVAVRFGYEYETVQRQWIGSHIPLTSRVQYSYDTNYQYTGSGSATQQLGQPTHVRYYATDTTPNPYLTERTWYRANLGDNAWVVRPTQTLCTRANIYPFENGTRFLYDSLAYGSQPTKGLPSRQVQLLPIAGTSNYQTVESAMAYDGYGNVTSTTSYGDYGSLVGSTHTLPINGRTTNIWYDTGYNLYPTRVRDPLNQETKFEIFGFKRSVDNVYIPLDGFQRQAGLLRRVVAPNWRNKLVQV